MWVVFRGSSLALVSLENRNETKCAVIFTHQTLADAYVESHADIEVKNLTAIEVMQATKTALLAGGTLWAINKGDTSEAYVFLSGILKTFIYNVLKDKTLFDDRVDALITAFRNMESGRFSAVFDAAETEKWAVTGNHAVICDSCESLDKLFTEPVLTHPITPPMLFSLPCDKLWLLFNGNEYEYYVSDVKNILYACGYTGNIPDQDSLVSFDDYPNTDEILAHWQIENIYLSMDSFRPAPKEIQEKATIEEEMAPIKALVPIGCNGVDKETSKTNNKAKKVGVAITAIYTKVRHKTEDIVSKVREKAEEYRQRKKQREDIEVTPEKEKKRKTFHMIFAIGVSILAIVLIISTILLVQHTQYRKNFIQFCEYLDNRDYGNAYVVYKENDFYEDGTSYLTKSLDALVISYARNEISAEELNASITALSKFPGIDHEISVARLTAQKLEESKNSYVRGKNSTSTYDRLTYWQQVIDLDEVNFLAVKKNVEDNQQDYEKTIEEEIEYYSTRNRDFAQKRWQILQYWYPNSEVVGKWREDYSVEDTEPLSTYPIKIQLISIKQESDQYWSLRIDWENISAKTISSVRFSFIAEDSKGNLVTCHDSNGSWSMFDAKDPGPFEPGTGHDTDNYLWHGAWYGPDVAKVKLTGVYIEFKDGTTIALTSSADLENIQ